MKVGILARRATFARAVTFFDAIFAFAVTLLITTVDNFEPATWSSLDALMDVEGTALLVFAISFVVVVSFWRANHQQVTAFLALDNQLIMLNCLVMFGVVLVPWTTEAMGKLSEYPLPVALYAINISAVYVLQHVVGFVAERKGVRGRAKLTGSQLRWELVDAVALPIVFLGSIPIAYLVSASAAQRSWLLLLIIMPIIGNVQSKLAKSAAAQLDDPGHDHKQRGSGVEPTT